MTTFCFSFKAEGLHAHTFYEGPTTKDKKATELFHDRVKQSRQDSAVTEISAHPRHKNQMKPHQVEGFNFLLSDLVAENREFSGQVSPCETTGGAAKRHSGYMKERVLHMAS
ncbi:hypothetical protein ACSBR1_005702 [Camellia fascicularis]